MIKGRSLSFNAIKGPKAQADFTTEDQFDYMYPRFVGGI
jgi:hypothetical protein